MTALEFGPGAAGRSRPRTAAARPDGLRLGSAWFERADGGAALLLAVAVEA
jgi:hypothetical protein